MAYVYGQHKNKYLYKHKNNSNILSHCLFFIRMFKVKKFLFILYPLQGNFSWYPLKQPVAYRTFIRYLIHRIGILIYLSQYLSN